MNSSEDFQTGQILAEMKNLYVCLERVEKGHGDKLEKVEQSIIEFKQGMGQRVQNHGERLVVVEAGLRLLNGVAWLLFTSSMAVVVATFWKLIIKAE